MYNIFLTVGAVCGILALIVSGAAIMGIYFNGLQLKSIREIVSSVEKYCVGFAAEAQQTDGQVGQLFIIDGKGQPTTIDDLFQQMKSESSPNMNEQAAKFLMDINSELPYQEPNTYTDEDDEEPFM